MLTSSQTLVDLGTLQLQLSFDSDKTPQYWRLLHDAEMNLTAGLAQNPANGLGWLRLAIAQDDLHRAPRFVADSLLRSVDMAPNLRGLWLARARLMLVYWPAMAPGEALEVKAQLRGIWEANSKYREPLVAMAAELDQIAVVRWALEANAQDLDDFDRLATSSGPLK
jgi:hypothetical protein